jgi:hypothetical protein
MYSCVIDFGIMAEQSLVIVCRGGAMILGIIMAVYRRSQDSVVGIATSCGLDEQGVGVRVPVRERTFTSPCHPDGLWGPPNLLSNGHLGLFPRG